MCRQVTVTPLRKILAVWLWLWLVLVWLMTVTIHRNQPETTSSPGK